MEWHGAAGVVIHESKVLMVKTIHEEGWSIPSGGLEENEHPEQAVIREIYEETGYQASISDHIQQFKKFVDHQNVTVDYYVCHLEGGDGIHKDPDEEIESVRWFSIDELDEIEWMYPEDKELIAKKFMR